jgi:acetyl-CoA carboxylase biotin carboxyl carrier protein
MDLNLIKKLIKIVEQSEISELTVQEGELKVAISKISKNSNVVYQNIPQAVPAGHPVQKEAIPEIIAAAVPVENKNLYEIKSPIVGTFYKASTPDSDPFVKVGDHIAPGAVLCIVEAMKLMNEIESDVSGKIIKILVDNASPVEYNQPLFLIEKD